MATIIIDLKLNDNCDECRGAIAKEIEMGHKSLAHLETL